MNCQQTLLAVSAAGLTLVASKTEGKLRAWPANKLTPELAAAIKKHKEEIISIMREDERRREDERLKESGIIQSERQVFELARECFRLRGKGEESRAGA